MYKAILKVFFKRGMKIDAKISLRMYNKSCYAKAGTVVI